MKILERGSELGPVHRFECWQCQARLEAVPEDEVLEGRPYAESDRNNATFQCPQCRAITNADRRRLNERWPRWPR